MPLSLNGEQRRSTQALFHEVLDAGRRVQFVAKEQEAPAVLHVHIVVDVLLGDTGHAQLVLKPPSLGGQACQLFYLNGKLEPSVVELVAPVLLAKSVSLLSVLGMG